LNLHHHLATGGELDGVGYQVVNDLAHPQGVANQCLRHIGGNIQNQFEAFLMGRWRHQRDRGFDAIGEIEYRRFQHNAVGLQARDIEDVIDQLQ